tara:strand:- start:395 stop:709 length:315 start_codon:yes stop_codon:yes gene_type:complete
VRYILLLSFLLINTSFVNTAFASSEIESTKVSELSVEDLRKIVRSIVQDSIEKCEVNGTMEGRAKVNLRVEGEVNAKMTCDFNKSITRTLDSSLDKYSYPDLEK